MEFPLLLLLVLGMCCRCHGNTAAQQVVRARLSEAVILDCPNARAWDRTTWETEDGRLVGVGSSLRFAAVTPNDAGVYVCRKLRLSPDAGSPRFSVSTLRLAVATDSEPADGQTDAPSIALSSTASTPGPASTPTTEPNVRETSKPDRASVDSADVVCLANQVACGLAAGSQAPPAKACILKDWLCDGENDCYNGWDEENCPNDSVCHSRSYTCENSTRSVPMGYRCDGEVDCEHGDDERDCAAPIFVSPSGLKRIYQVVATRSSAPVRMKCSARGRPAPTIVWRFNGRRVMAQHRVEESCEPTGGGSLVVHSVLLVEPRQPEDTGFYTCEANSGSGRTFSPDFFLRVI